MCAVKYDMVNHPKHYTSSKTGIEVIEVTRYLSGSLSNAWKYCCRYMSKGKPRQDLKKAIFYLNDFLKFPAISSYTCTDAQCEKLLENMDKFIEVEDSEEIKDTMLLIKNFVHACLTGKDCDGFTEQKINAKRVIKHLDIYADAIGEEDV